MVKRIRIENFKCFESLSVNELGRLTLLGGQNNVGKTAFLEALFLFLDKRSEQRVLGPYARRGLRQVDRRPEIAWAPIFHDYDLTKEVRITLEEDGQAEDLCVRLVKDFAPPTLPGKADDTTKGVPTSTAPRTSDALEFEDSEGRKWYLSIDRYDGTIQTAVIGVFPDVKPVTFLGTRSHPRESDAHTFGELDRLGETQRVIDFLRTIEPDLESLSIIPLGEDPVIHAKLRRMRVKIPVVFMGEGMSRLLSIILAMVRSRGGIVMIDEIENGIHHTVQAPIWSAIAKAAAKLPCQVFATTHSYEFLRHAQEALAGGEYANDFRYIRLERNAKGGHVAKSYDIETVRTAVEMGLEVR